MMKELVEELEAKYGFPIQPVVEMIAAFILNSLSREKPKTWMCLRDKIVEILDRCHQQNVKDIEEDYTLTRLDKLEFKVRRASFELTQLHYDGSSSLATDIWTELVKMELKEWEDKWGERLKSLKEASFEQNIRLLEAVKGMVISADASNAVTIAENANQTLNQLGLHPFFFHTMPLSKSLVARVGRQLMIDVPKCRLVSLGHVHRRYLSSTLKWFSGQEHATTVVLNRKYRSTLTVGKRRPWTFLAIDPTSQNWEDFVEGLSRSISYGQEVDVLRFDFSANDSSRSGSSLGSDEKGQLEKLFKDVHRKPYSIVVLEKIHRAHDSAIGILHKILQSGCLSDGTVVDISRAVFIFVVGGSSSSPLLMNPNCQALCGTSSRSLLDIYSNISDVKGHDCPCIPSIDKVKQHVHPVLWQILDDVIVFGQLADCHLKVNARRLLRDIARLFLDGQLVIYPSEAALDAIIKHVESPKGVSAVKQWLRGNVVPVMQSMVDEGAIKDKSVVFIDVHAGTTELSYRVESISSLSVHEETEDLLRFIASWRAIYGRGKELEFDITLSRHSLCGVVNENEQVSSFLVSAMHSVANYMGMALNAAKDINSFKGKLGFPVEGIVSRSKADERQKGDQIKPEMIALVEAAMLVKKVDVLDQESPMFPASYLLLGLRSDSKLKLVRELERNMVNDHVRLVTFDLSENAGDDLLLFSLAHSTSLTGDECGVLRVLEIVKKHPNSILVFDRVEEAHISVFNMLTSVLITGCVIHEGNTVDFRSTVIILASDAADVGKIDASLRCTVKDDGCINSSREVMHDSRRALVEKVDEVIVFNPAASDQLRTELIRLPKEDRILKGKSLLQKVQAGKEKEKRLHERAQTLKAKKLREKVRALKEKRLPQKGWSFKERKLSAQRAVV